MAEFGGEGAEVHARIVYWGIEGAGKTTNLRVIHSKLRPDHRGELRRVPTRLDPTVTYATLPIELGAIGGVRTRIHIVTVPGGPEHGPTRKQLLDRADGIVFVIDTTRERLDENLAAFEELRSALSAYGRAVEEVPLVLQYNKRDQSDAYALEELHRKLQMRGVAAFEAVAAQGTAVLQTLTTISKRVIRHLREPAARAAGVGAAATGAAPASPAASAPAAAPPRGPAEAAPPPRPQPAPAAAAGPPTPAAPAEGPQDPERRERRDPAAAHARTAARAEALFEPSFQELTQPTEGPAAAGPSAAGPYEIAAVGRAVKAGPRAVRVPVLLEDDAGHRLPVTLTVQIDPEPGAGA
ncbi:MAG: ADP-ribosylation factor-like protein [Myxococcota bacterium]|nr:ADP-ribosylation factor-like protein [Myxococcota bacterium]